MTEVKKENKPIKKLKESENQTVKEKGLTGFDMRDFNTTEEEIAKVTKKEIVTIPVGMPSNQIFFLIHPEIEATADLLLWIGDKNYYIVHKKIIGHLSNLTRKTKLYLGITQDGDHFLLPVTLPDNEGKQNPWHESRDKIVQIAKKRWTRCQSKKNVAGYDAFKTVNKYPEQEWTDRDINEILSIAFADHMIQKEDHPVIKSIKGIK